MEISQKGVLDLVEGQILRRTDMAAQLCAPRRNCTRHEPECNEVSIVFVVTGHSWIIRHGSSSGCGHATYFYYLLKKKAYQIQINSHSHAPFLLLHVFRKWTKRLCCLTPSPPSSHTGSLLPCFSFLICSHVSLFFFCLVHTFHMIYCWYITFYIEFFTFHMVFYIEFYTEFTSKLVNKNKNVKQEYIAGIAFCLFYFLYKFYNRILIFFLKCKAE